ncbi:MAG TPA: VOC family protein [Casimicrobiaceae bacterium]|nr:VOC family protein [Casimicrobiaceae bacterium]
MIVAFDHLIVAAATLEQGEDYLEAKLGARPQRGGKHVAMGTHNSLLKLGPRTFLELIAIDPEGTAPTTPRWFALDAPVMREALKASPRLIHWVARTDDIEAAGHGFPVELGPAQPMERGSFRWRITIPGDGGLPGGGLVPTLIQWRDARHPADTLPESGLRLAALAGAHPQPATIRNALSALGLGDAIKVTFSATPRLAAMLQTRLGAVTL